MQRLDGRFVYSASDLNDYLECKRLTELEALVARRKLLKPDATDERGDLMRRKGEEHERRHLAALHERHPGEVKEFPRADADIEAYFEAERRTLQAMRDGVRVIYQATFFDGTFIGHADFLVRVERPSALGAYGYEVVDTKLALSPKAYYLVQLCNYSEHLARLQGVMPDFCHVVYGDGSEQRFRLNDYMAYYRHLKRSFLEFAGDEDFDRLGDAREYPLRCKHCDVCAWNDSCKSKRVDDDHLSLVAWMRRDQIGKLESGGIARLDQLAAVGDDDRPTGMNPDTFVKLRRQARLQLRGRETREAHYELLEHLPPLGFALLPQPAYGDVFFDMEGDPLYEPGRGLEYLFGCWMPDDDPRFRAFWGKTRALERLAFEDFVDFVTERRQRHPDLHIYHYASYEKSALRRLAQEHNTRENEVDALLRDNVLVDLFTVVRQAVVISEERYSLKKLERFYDLARATDVKKGDESIVMFERWLRDGNESILADIEAYNQDDCQSAFLLREWLLARRLEAETTFGTHFPYYVPRPTPAASGSQAEDDERSELERTLLAGMLPPLNETEYERMTEAHRARYLLASLLSYHRREEKPQWWAYFDRCENLDRLLEFDREAIAGMRLREEIPAESVKQSKVYTFEFPEQHHKMSPGGATDPRIKKSVTITALDTEKNLLQIKTKLPLEQVREIREVIPNGPPPTKPQRDALAHIARSFLGGRLHDEYPATNDLLFKRPPRLAGGERKIQPAEVDARNVLAVAKGLDESYLFVQGPPGSGKSTYGSEMICDLLRGGMRVAVTSTGHAAIHNLLHKVEACMSERGDVFRGRYKYSNANAGSEFRSRHGKAMIVSVDSNESFDDDDYQLAGGTSWLFSRSQLAGKFDYLFIDEAGQVSLADTLAVSLCARNVVLLGDPSQLAQVSQGSQPLHAGDSILQHLLGDHQTIPEDRGIFLNVTYRMQTQICAFVSGAMYENRLTPSEKAREHRVRVGSQDLAGLYFAPVEHAGNSSSSPDEAAAIVEAIARIYPYERNIIVVTPYNAQRRTIAASLARDGFDVPVGTVDKFQGQEAAVVFYSMATSSGEDVPRDMEFLFERNRFNVAISRARAASILVCSPRLLDISCRSPEEMALANLLCAFEELATRGLALLDSEGDGRAAAAAMDLEAPRGGA